MTSIFYGGILVGARMQNLIMGMCVCVGGEALKRSFLIISEGFVSNVDWNQFKQRCKTTPDPYGSS